MIVLGADMHKGSHTIAAVAARTGELLDDKTVSVGARGFGQVLPWARGLGSERVWALEDCRTGLADHRARPDEEARADHAPSTIMVRCRWWSPP
jgi:hypothetical protein